MGCSSGSPKRNRVHFVYSRGDLKNKLFMGERQRFCGVKTACGATPGVMNSVQVSRVGEGTAAVQGLHQQGAGMRSPSWVSGPGTLRQGVWAS